MSISLLTLEQFVASRDPPPRAFFTTRESSHERRYETHFDPYLSA